METDLKYIWEIAASRSGRIFSESDWMAIIDRKDNLRRIPDQKVLNPFIPGGSIEIKSPPTTAQVFFNDERVGTIVYGVRKRPFLQVYSEFGTHENIFPIVQELAKTLNGLIIEVSRFQQGPPGGGSPKEYELPFSLQDFDEDRVGPWAQILAGKDPETVLKDLGERYSQLK